MTARYPDSMTAVATQAHVVRDATDGDQRAVVLAVLRRVENGILERAGAYVVLAALGLLDAATDMRLAMSASPAPESPPPTAPPELSPARPEHGAEALAYAVTTRRAHLGLSQRAIAERGGPGPNVIREIESGVRTPRHATCDRLDHALGWELGTTARILGGNR